MLLGGVVDGTVASGRLPRWVLVNTCWATAGALVTPPSGVLVSTVMRLNVMVGSVAEDPFQKNINWPPGTRPSADPCVKAICGAAAGALAAETNCGVEKASPPLSEPMAHRRLRT